MTQRKFHHPDGWIAAQYKYDKRFYELINPKGAIVGTILSDIVESENSNDWQEITEKVEEPILVTKDGFEKYEGDKVYKVYVDWNGGNYLMEVKEDDKFAGITLANFHYKENAEAYIERNKPKYSDEDLDHIRRVVDEDIDYYVNEHELKGSIMTAIENLRELKND